MSPTSVLGAVLAARETRDPEEHAEVAAYPVRVAAEADERRRERIARRAARRAEIAAGQGA
jgi:hypothetical protein